MLGKFFSDESGHTTIEYGLTIPVSTFIVGMLVISGTSLDSILATVGTQVDCAMCANT